MKEIWEKIKFLNKEDRMKLDGYDLGILIRIKRFRKMFEDRIYGELVSEVGWLKGGEDECLERLKKMEKMGLIECDENSMWSIK